MTAIARLRTSLTKSFPRLACVTNIYNYNFLIVRSNNQASMLVEAQIPRISSHLLKMQQGVTFVLLTYRTAFLLLSVVDRNHMGSTETDKAVEGKCKTRLEKTAQGKCCPVRSIGLRA